MLIYTHATMAVRHSLDADWRVLAVVRAVRVVCWRNKRSKSTAKTNKKMKRMAQLTKRWPALTCYARKDLHPANPLFSLLCVCVCVCTSCLFSFLFSSAQRDRNFKVGVFLFILSTKIITLSIIFWFDSIWYQIDKYFLFVFDFYSFLFIFKDLHPEFRTVPLATRGILGEPATLECEPPRGHPEPQVRWKKNGQPLDLNVGAHRDHSSARFVPLSF